ncbi:hypothetical protein SAMN02800692_1549 [Luteibacter sp. UNC138MFCol5.1]|uniref:hypothetical protein n=1 Tax=Luteibacter sp. UNC138MFCol5.1 TaxID=1502774 RepID=UPI0008ABDF68|nr:hypothetical protein [Luteibacter sp. UNC138MFCol5.1]SEO64050.1 hypothetical protein SAMN02800692_1549 [Luteibacter sp. UNC138MFCol5.1]
MNRLTIRERQALRYAVTKRAGDREVRDERAAEQLRHASSSTPALQRWFEERGGWLVVFILIGAAVSLTACGEWRARPDLKVSTLTQSSAACVRGHKTEQVGTMGLYGTPVVVVTAERCEAKP